MITNTGIRILAWSFGELGGLESLSAMALTLASTLGRSDAGLPTGRIAGMSALAVDLNVGMDVEGLFVGVDAVAFVFDVDVILLFVATVFSHNTMAVLSGDASVKRILAKQEQALLTCGAL